MFIQSANKTFAIHFVANLEMSSNTEHLNLTISDLNEITMTSYFDHLCEDTGFTLTVSLRKVFPFRCLDVCSHKTFLVLTQDIEAYPLYTDVTG